MSAVQVLADFAFEKAIAQICELNWAGLEEQEAIHVAWAYYYFSIQFRENLQVARALHPDDEKLQDLEREECKTANLSPWPGVAQPGEAMDHDEFMKRVLTLAPISEAHRLVFEQIGARYLRAVREMNATTRALSISSYEDGGLERVFRAMLRVPEWQNSLLAGFRHFLAEHIRFDSDPTQGHGAMARHLQPDDRILPLWLGFRDILIACAPRLAEPASAT